MMDDLTASAYATVLIAFGLYANRYDSTAPWTVIGISAWGCGVAFVAYKLVGSF